MGTGEEKLPVQHLHAGFGAFVPDKFSFWIGEPSEKCLCYGTCIVHSAAVYRVPCVPSAVLDAWIYQ